MAGVLTAGAALDACGKIINQPAANDPTVTRGRPCACHFCHVCRLSDSSSIPEKRQTVGYHPPCSHLILFDGHASSACSLHMYIAGRHAATYTR